MASIEAAICEAVKVILQKYSWHFDVTRKGRVSKKISNNVYEVMINGHMYKIKSNFTYDVNDIVLVLFPQGNSTDLYLYPNK